MAKAISKFIAEFIGLAVAVWIVTALREYLADPQTAAPTQSPTLYVTATWKHDDADDHFLCKGNDDNNVTVTINGKPVKATYYKVPSGGCELMILNPPR